MRILLSLLVALFATTTFASGKIEVWKNQGLKFVERAEDGRFQDQGSLKLESWNDGDQTSEWVARKADGTFVTGYKGKLEKFVVDGKDKEAVRLVIRNSKGQFVTWEAMDELLTAGWEKWSDGTWAYVVRYDGQFVNWSKGKFEYWKNYGKVLVVRDTADEENNGKLMTWIAPETLSSGQVVYRNEKGQFITAK